MWWGDCAKNRYVFMQPGQDYLLYTSNKYFTICMFTYRKFHKTLPRSSLQMHWSRQGFMKWPICYVDSHNNVTSKFGKLFLVRDRINWKRRNNRVTEVSLTELTEGGGGPEQWFSFVFHCKVIFACTQAKIPFYWNEKGIFSCIIIKLAFWWFWVLFVSTF